MFTCLILFDSLRRFWSLKADEVFISKKIFLFHCVAFMLFLLTSIFQIIVLQNPDPTVKVDAITNEIFQSMIFLDQLSLMYLLYRILQHQVSTDLPNDIGDTLNSVNDDQDDIIASKASWIIEEGDEFRRESLRTIIKDACRNRASSQLIRGATLGILDIQIIGSLMVDDKLSN